MPGPGDYYYERPGVSLIAKWIRERRLGQGLTQQELADLCGTKQPIVSRWEMGVRIPHTRHRDALRRVFGHDIPMDGISWQR